MNDEKTMGQLPDHMFEEHVKLMTELHKLLRGYPGMTILNVLITQISIMCEGMNDNELEVFIEETSKGLRQNHKNFKEWTDGNKDSN